MFTPEVRASVDHPTEIWFNERARELTFRSVERANGFLLEKLKRERTADYRQILRTIVWAFTGLPDLIAYLTTDPPPSRAGQPAR